MLEIKEILFSFKYEELCSKVTVLLAAAVPDKSATAGVCV